METIYSQIIQTSIVIITIITLGIRLEHRITKIETDVSWMKRLTELNCGESKERKEG